MKPRFFLFHLRKSFCLNRSSRPEVFCKKGVLRNLNTNLKLTLQYGKIDKTFKNESFKNICNRNDH